MYLDAQSSTRIHLNIQDIFIAAICSSLLLHFFSFVFFIHSFLHFTLTFIDSLNTLLQMFYMHGAVITIQFLRHPSWDARIEWHLKPKICYGFNDKIGGLNTMELAYYFVNITIISHDMAWHDSWTFFIVYFLVRPTVQPSNIILPVAKNIDWLCIESGKKYGQIHQSATIIVNNIHSLNLIYPKTTTTTKIPNLDDGMNLISELSFVCLRQI